MSSLPGAVGMYALSLGVQHINTILPLPVYALLSGLNASTVGIIALAAVQLAEKAIKDRLSRILVIFGACAGMCYNALWYFPVLMVAGGLATSLWDGWLSQKIGKAKAALQRRKREHRSREGTEADESAVTLSDSVPREQSSQLASRGESTARSRKQGQSPESLPQPPTARPLQEAAEEISAHHVISIRVGIAITVAFFGMNSPPQR